MRSLCTSLIGLALLFAATPATAAPRKPGATETICRKNQLVGYGLIVGLPNTGDSSRAGNVAQSILKATVARVGRGEFDPSVLDHKVAAVRVTAYLRSCAYSDGSYDVKLDRAVDLKITAVGDATSLQGGALPMTPLVGADGQTYAMGQGVLVSYPDQEDPRSAYIVGGGVVAK
jgi:flagellar P-ring protein precursor FlgI